MTAVRRIGLIALALLTALAVIVGVTWVTLSWSGSGRPTAAARSSGHDALWLGHAWVDGRKTQADVDALAQALRTTGIGDLFVHSGPFGDDGTLDPALMSRAQWTVGALHRALPGVRVQAWLGAHPLPGQLELGSPRTRTAMLAAIGHVLDDGFDGVHLDLEPVQDGDANMVALLAATHDLTRQRHAVLSLSASLLASKGVASAVASMPGHHAVWSPGYLRELAEHVDQVALMAYDTGSWTASMYTGLVRRLTGEAWDAVPSTVALLIGVPAYHDDNLHHHPGVETMASAIRGVRLGLGDQHPGRTFGVAIYVDFTATADDWATYREDWLALT